MTPEELLDATLEKARKVPIGGKVDAAELARRAIESARIEARVRRARRGRFLAGAAAAVAVLTLGWGAWTATRGWNDEDRAATSTDARDGARESESAPSRGVPAGDGRRGSSAESRRLRLASGDVLVGSPGGAFEVVAEERDRVVRLDEGDVLFDVVHRPRGSFVVRADDFSVTVLGTVFSVRREGDAIGVRVFEGSVLVRGADGDEVQRLGAGDLWVSRALAGMDEWRNRSEREWRVIAGEGGRAERRAPPAGANARRAASTQSEGRAEAAGPEAREALAGEDRSPADPELTSARARLAEGDFEAVLRACDAHPTEGAWLLLRADALRGLGRNEAAARAYEAAARSLADHRRVQAAFAAAQLRGEASPESALRLLARFGVTRVSSPLEERARALRIRLLRSVGRDDEADAEELAYEERFGDGRARAAEPSSEPTRGR